MHTATNTTSKASRKAEKRAAKKRLEDAPKAIDKMPDLTPEEGEGFYNKSPADEKAEREDLDPAEARAAYDAANDAEEPGPQDAPDDEEDDEMTEEQAAAAAAKAVIAGIESDIAKLSETDLLMLKRFTAKELRTLQKADLAKLKDRIVKADYKFGRATGDSPIATMRRLLANHPDLTMPAKDLAAALAKEGFADTPRSTVNATLAGWTGDLKALRAAGRIK